MNEEVQYIFMNETSVIKITGINQPLFNKMSESRRKYQFRDRYNSRSAKQDETSDESSDDTRSNKAKHDESNSSYSSDESSEEIGYETIEDSDDEESVIGLDQEEEETNVKNSQFNQVKIQLDRLKKNVVKYISSDGTAIQIKKSDLECLDGENYLNDVVIEFYLHYIVDQILPKAYHRRPTPSVYIFSSFFFEKMLNLKRDPVKDNHYLKERYESVKKWTDNVDIFEYDFLILPIFKDQHWNLAIICYPGNLVSDEIDLTTDKRCCILFMDSMGKFKNITKYSRLLLNFVQSELMERKMVDKTISTQQMPVFNPPTPQQPNENDCGLFLLHNAQKFLENPAVIFGKKRLATVNLKEWFDITEIMAKRNEIFETVIEINNNLNEENDDDDNDDDTPSAAVTRSGNNANQLNINLRSPIKNVQSKSPSKSSPSKINRINLVDESTSVNVFEGKSPKKLPSFNSIKATATTATNSLSIHSLSRTLRSGMNNLESDISRLDEYLNQNINEQQRPNQLFNQQATSSRNQNLNFNLDSHTLTSRKRKKAPIYDLSYLREGALIDLNDE